MREAVYDELNVLRRTRLHRRAAEALRTLGEDRHLEEIAAQLLQAASPADAREVAGLLVRAGRRARGAFDAAARLARRRGDPALLAEAALGFAGLGVAIVDLDADAIARLEEALEAAALSPLLRARLQARLAVELYYAPDRTRSEALSAEAVATGACTVSAAYSTSRPTTRWRRFAATAAALDLPQLA